MKDSLSNKIIRIVVFLLTLLAIQLMYPGKERVILVESVDPEVQVIEKVAFIKKLLKEEGPSPFSATTDSLLKFKGDWRVVNIARERVLDVLKRGIISDSSIVKPYEEVELHLSDRKVTTTPDRILDLRKARSILQRDTILFRKPSEKVAFVELSAFLLSENLRPTFKSRLSLFWTRLGLFFILLLFPTFYLGVLSRRRPPTWTDLTILTVSGLITLFVSYFVIKSGLSPYLTILPFFAIVINVTMDLSSSLFITTFIASIIGIYAGFQLAAFIFNLAVGWTAALSSRNFRNRYQIYWVVGLLILIGALVSWLLLPFSPMEYWNQITNLRDSTVSALLSGFLVVALLPLFEKMFRISTDFLLLELSNLNNPLLRQLSTKAAGTFTHSILLGNLCEAGARAIGANPLLARVAAYYHDIGKLSAPEYFIENQLGKKNPHDYLTPEQSRDILLRHTKEGVKIAKKAGLPREIIGVIETHHGTTLMAPFFAKAKKKNPNVDQKNYRYPGPKPRNKIEALCMLADAVEAAARSLNNPTQEQLREVIASVIMGRLKDGQLDNTDLTQKDLKAIEEAFYQVLVGVFHPRIKYPEDKGEKG